MGKPRIYLASGWFNSEQKKQMNEIYKVLLEFHKNGKIEFFSPFYDGIVLKKGDPDFRKKMKEVWELDIHKLGDSELIVACTQDNDVGTIFECGYGSASGCIILCYNSKPEYGLNLMLAQEARGFIKTPENLELAIESYIKAYYDKNIEVLQNWRWNLWEGETI